MCFFLPKIVRSPVYDHGHDEESRNGRDVKIDILDDYVWTLEGFRVSSDKYRSTGGLLEPPKECNGPTWAIVERGGSPQGVAAPPPIGSPNWTREGHAPPFLLLFPLPLPCLLLLLLGRTPSWTRKGGILLPVGVGLP